MPQNLNMVDAIKTALHEEMSSDEAVLVMGEDVGHNGGVFRATDGLQETFGEERCFDTPLAESAIIGTAIGMAIYGFKPVCEMQFSGFFYSGFDQLMTHASRMRNRSRGRFTVPMVVRMPYGGGIRALEHHSESTEAIPGHVPGVKVVIPSTPYDAKGLLISAIRDPDPVVFMEPKRLYRAFKQEIPDKPYTIPLGKAAIVEPGTDVTVIAWGAMVREVQKAAKMLATEESAALGGKSLDADSRGSQIDTQTAPAEQGSQNTTGAQATSPSLEIIDLRTISPLDEETILRSVEKTGRLIIVHEASSSFGPGAEIAALVAEKAVLSLRAPVQRVAGPDIIMPYLLQERLFLPDAMNVVEAIEKVMEY